jgi:uncharacterized membrane protein YgaE (UPF0421/DUF939 family)
MWDFWGKSGMYPLILAISAISTLLVCEEFQLQTVHWAVITSVVTVQSLSEFTGKDQMLIDAFERAAGSFLGIYFGYVTVVYMQILISDTFRWAYYIMIFVAVILTGALEYILPGFRLSVISCLLMITLLSQVDSTYALVPEYALSVMIGVVIGIICSFIFHAYKNTQNKA